MTGARDREVFTDTMAGTTRYQNDKKDGWSIGAGINHCLIHEAAPVTDLLGEIFVDYSRFSRERVVVATSALLGAPRVSQVSVSELMVAIAPKARINVADGLVRPWVIPIGMAFLVNSPPSDATTYLDFGLHFGAGVDFRIAGPVRLGVDMRYTLGFGQANVNNSFLSVGSCLGIDF